MNIYTGHYCFFSLFLPFFPFWTHHLNCGITIWTLFGFVTLRQITPKRTWQPSTLWSDCIRPSMGKEKNILTGEITVEHIKVSAQICGIWKVPSLSLCCMKFTTSHCLFQMVCWVLFSFIPRESRYASICYAVFL